MFNNYTVTESLLSLLNQYWSMIFHADSIIILQILPDYDFTVAFNSQFLSKQSFKEILQFDGAVSESPCWSGLVYWSISQTFKVLCRFYRFIDFLLLLDLLLTICNVATSLLHMISAGILCFEWCEELPQMLMSNFSHLFAY